SSRGCKNALVSIVPGDSYREDDCPMRCRFSTQATLLALILVAGAAALTQRQTIAQQPARARSGEPTPHVVNSTIRPWIEKYEPPGTMVVVHREGKTEFFPFGEANRAKRVTVSPDSIFELASITKVFATTSLAIEVERGRMRLDDPVDKYLPRLREG